MSAERHARLQALFIEARRLDAPARAAYLDDACGGDADLRDELDDLLAADDEGSDGAASLVGTGARLLVEGAAEHAATAPLPETIGRYRVLRVIGEGGMGVVYEAQQEDPRRRVALKIIRASMVTPGMLRRFRHEAHVLGQLQHPGIAQIHEAGTADTGEGGRPFFAMELVEGAPLPEYAKAHDLGTRARLELIARICDAVHHAHQKGVIHRDLKPGNVLVVDGGDGAPQPKVLDFGVARVTDADLQTVTINTDVGQLVGTVPYMSPEQASGDPDRIDIRSDVYSLGVLAYELLTGRLPYAVQGKMIHEAVRTIQEEEPSRLSAASRSYRGDIETIVATALEKETERRYQSAAELAADIRRHLADEPIFARPASSLYQLRKFARRNRALVGGVAAVVLVSILGAVVSARYAVRANATAQALAEREAAAQWPAYRATIAAAGGSVRDHHTTTAADYLDGAAAAYRGWEWRYLRAQLETHRRQWDLPDPPLRSEPAFAPDGRTMVCLMDGAVLGTWDVGTGVCTATRELGDAVADDSTGVLSGASDRFAATAPDGALVIGRCSTGAVEARVDDFDGRAHPIAWDASGERLLFLAGERLRVRDADGTTWMLPVGGAPGCFVDDGATVLLSIPYGTGGARPIDVASGSVGAAILLPDYMREWDVAPDGRRVACGGRYRNVFILDAATRAITARCTGHRRTVDDVAFSPDGAVLLSAARDGTLRTWDADTGAALGVFETGEVSDDDDGLHDRLRAAWLPSGDRVLSLGARIREHDVDPDAGHVLRGHGDYVYFVDVSPDGTLIASTTHGGGRIRLWDAFTGEPIAAFEAPPPGWYQYFAPTIQFSLDGERLVSTNQKVTHVVDLATGRMTILDAGGFDTVADVRGGSRGTRTARFDVCSADGRFRLMGGSRTSVPVRAIRVDAPDVPLFELEDWSNGVTIDPDDRLIAASTTDGPVKLYDAADGARAGTLVGHVGPSYVSAFHPTEPRIATGGEDGIVRIWDLATREEVLELHGHDSYVMALAFSPDGTMLVSGSGDATLRIWDSVPPFERQRQADADARRRDALRPWVEALRDELGDAEAVAAAIAEAPDLGADDRRAARRVLLEMNSEVSPRGRDAESG